MFPRNENRERVRMFPRNENRNEGPFAKATDPPILALPISLLFSDFPFFSGAFFLYFPRILGGPQREKPLLFWGGSLKQGLEGQGPPSYAGRHAIVHERQRNCSCEGLAAGHFPLFFRVSRRNDCYRVTWRTLNGRGLTLQMVCSNFLPSAFFFLAAGNCCKLQETAGSYVYR